MAVDVGVVALVADVEVVVVPEDSGGGLLLRAGLRVPGEQELDGGRGGPRLIVELAIDDDAGGGALHFVARDGLGEQGRAEEQADGQCAQGHESTLH